MASYRKCSALVISLALVASVTADFSTNCPVGCSCKWVSGSKQADCLNYTQVPQNLSNDVQNLILTGNVIHEIRHEAFIEAGIANLKKLIMKGCQLESIQKFGLKGLGIMIELDLSGNELQTLYPETFRETDKIRWIFLNDNKIDKIEDGLFNNLKFLQKLDLSKNRIFQIGVKAFMNVPNFKDLRLNSNALEYVKVDAVEALVALNSLDVEDNPWRCDCYLQPFRDWMFRKNLYRTPVSCAEPPGVHGKTWFNSSEFACKPKIMYPLAGTTIRSGDNNITLSCQVNGNPPPRVNWVLNSQVIDSAYRYQAEPRYILTSNRTENSEWLNLTIINASSNDDGEYLCTAKNSGGIDERILSLSVAHNPPGVVVPTGMDNNMLPVLIGVSCTAAILLIILIFLCYCCCRRRSLEKKKANNSNGEALIEGSVIPEMEKSLISAVNPVTKPPRRYDVPPSITSGATEMSELNKTLLDNDSISALNDDEKRSLEFDHQPKRSQDTLNIDYGRQDGSTYPPDLLSFPPRAAQISPAASNASTVPDTTRLPPQLNPISPIHSPIYGMTPNPNLFKTLPYSRSQSPFTAPISTPVVTPRQGYVTIPRRPRVPSWSSTTSTQILPSGDAQEPLYDNLGLRTTADGSSVLSLNKTGLEQQFSPMKNRPLPATPSVYQNPPYYAPIEEQEPTSPVQQYVQNNAMIPSVGQFSPIPVEHNHRMSWTGKNTPTPQPEPRKTLFNGMDSLNRNDMPDTSTLNRRGKPETGSLRRIRPERKEDNDTSVLSSPSKEDTKNNTSLNQSTGTLGRSGKIPPRPPPKPKKKPNPDANQNEPLFEDEGEDGTEV